MPENKLENELEPTLKRLTLIYLLLIISGLCYSYFFYRNFGVVITEFIELNEALLIFLPLLANSFGIVLLLTICMSFSFLEMFRRDLFKGASKKEKLMVLLGGALFILAIAGVVAIIMNDADTFYGGLATIIIFCSPFFLENVFENLQLNFSKLVKTLIYSLIVIFVFIIWRTHSAYKIINGKNHIKPFTIVFREPNHILKSGDNYYYLGRTKNFIFIYDFKYKASRVFNVNDVKEFVTAK